MTFSSAIKRQINRYRHAATKKTSYAQCGEDLIVEYAARTLGLPQVRHLDLGAHHPIYLSNTYLFYLQGHRGVCVEADASLLPAFRRHRPLDIVLNAGVGPQDAQLPFYVMTTPTLNTFSRAEAERYASYGRERIERVEQVGIRGVKGLVAEFFPDGLEFVSLDVEGLDLAILEAFDFASARPPIFCVETLTYTEDGTERKLGEIIAFMDSVGYFAYADTYVNTIFVDRAAWARRAARG
ncbi:MAG: FkbM family methyltransferase [Burkholderiales bacterium]|nr:FkbM family methyltransferase [Burkholderiales bacterium]